MNRPDGPSLHVSDSPGKDALVQTWRARFVSLPLPAWIVMAMGLGILVGPWVGEGAPALGSVGSVVIQLIKAIATPLLFLAIVRAISTSEVRGRLAVRMLGIALVNVSAALAIGLVLSNLFQPGAHLRVEATGDTAAFSETEFDFSKTLRGFVPTDVVTPFAQNSVFAVVVLALLFGFALRAARRGAPEIEQSAQLLESATGGLYRVVEIILGWILHLIPLAVFAVVAKTVAEQGLAPLRGLLVYVLVGVSGLTLHALVTYQAWAVLFCKLPLKKFWRAAREPVFVALGSNSSLATLPVTLRALDGLGVSRSASALGACVGTNLNNDGIVLYEGMAVLLVAQAHGIHLSLGQQLLVALFCIVAAMGVAGVPEAGFISLALVLNAVGLPLDLLPVLLTVDWVLARGRSAVNVLSDMVLSLVLDATIPKDERAALPDPPEDPLGVS